MAIIQETPRGHVSSPAETPSALPIVEQFRQGEISHSALKRNTVSLSQFFRDNKLALNQALFGEVYDGFYTNPAIIRIQLKKPSKPRGYEYHYRVDPSLADTLLLPQLQARFPELTPRTPEEKAQAQTQLLRVRRHGGLREYHSITLDEAFDRLRKRAVLLFSSFPDPSELFARAITAATPYLLGERGTFADFSTFERFFNRVMLRKKIDWLRSQRREIAVDPQEPTGVLFQTPADEIENQEAAEEAMRVFLRDRLTGDQTRLMELRVIDKQSYKDIAAIDEQRRGEGALRQAVRRAKLALRHPKEKKTPTHPPIHRRRGHGISDEVLMQDYKIFRDDFIGQTGRLPTSYDIKKAREGNRMAIHTYHVYARRFGSGSWPTAQTKLEQLLS